MDEAIDAFIFHLRVQRGLSENTIQSYSRTLLRLSSFLAGRKRSLDPASVKRDGLESFLRAALDTGLSTRSLAAMVVAIRQFFRYAVERELVDKDPTEELEIPRCRRASPIVL